MPRRIGTASQRGTHEREVQTGEARDQKRGGYVRCKITFLFYKTMQTQSMRHLLGLTHFGIKRWDFMRKAYASPFAAAVRPPPPPPLCRSRFPTYPCTRALLRPLWRPLHPPHMTEPYCANLPDDILVAHIAPTLSGPQLARLCLTARRTWVDPRPLCARKKDWREWRKGEIRRDIPRELYLFRARAIPPEVDFLPIESDTEECYASIAPVQKAKEIFADCRESDQLFIALAPLVSECEVLEYPSDHIQVGDTTFWQLTRQCRFPKLRKLVVCQTYSKGVAHLAHLASESMEPMFPVLEELSGGSAGEFLRIVELCGPRPLRRWRPRQVYHKEAYRGILAAIGNDSKVASRVPLPAVDRWSMHEFIGAVFGLFDSVTRRLIIRQFFDDNLIAQTEDWVHKRIVIMRLLLIDSQTFDRVPEVLGRDWHAADMLVALLGRATADQSTIDQVLALGERALHQGTEVALQLVKDLPRDSYDRMYDRMFDLLCLDNVMQFFTKDPRRIAALLESPFAWRAVLQEPRYHRVVDELLKRGGAEAAQAAQAGLAAASRRCSVCSYRTTLYWLHRHGFHDFCTEANADVMLMTYDGVLRESIGQPRVMPEMEDEWLKCQRARTAWAREGRDVGIERK